MQLSIEVGDSRRADMEPKRKKAKAQRNGFLNSSNLNKVDRRFSTATADGEDEERLGPMSAAVKERIIKYKKAGSNTDPFSKESQGVRRLQTHQSPVSNLNDCLSYKLSPVQ